MVVRFGEGHQQAQGFVPQRYRILQGQGLHLQYVSDTAAMVRAWARVYYDNGVDSILYVPDQALTGDRLAAVLAPSDVAIADGWIVDAVVECVTDGVKRGQAYVKLNVALPSLIFGTVLCADYVFSTFGQVALGTYSPPGPGGGSGNLQQVTVKSDSAPATTTYTLALSNTIRRVHSFVWYYNASSDVASRALAVRLRNILGALPTGMTSAGAIDVWRGDDITLTADQEGTVFADPKRGGSNDNVTIVIQDAAADPSVFPLLIQEDDLATLIFTPTLGEVADRDSIYILLEEWIVL